MHLGQTPPVEPTWYEKLFEGTSKLLQTAGSVQTTRDIYKINKQRAAQGLPPIDASSLSPQVNVGLAPGTIQQAALPVGLIVGALALLFLMNRK